MTDDDPQQAVPGFLYGTAWKEDDTQRCVEDAIEAGFRGIDTANQRVHYHEAGVGAALQRQYEKGTVTREDLFLQTKFSPPAAQDDRVPYDIDARLSTQVYQSFESSQQHLGTDVLDALLLHGPSMPMALTPEDWEVWRTMEDLQLRGKVRHLGVSNVSSQQLADFYEGAKVKPSFVQNRCLVRNKWDKAVRDYCREQAIVYQGFALLTGNAELGQDKRFVDVARRLQVTPAQVVFRFAMAIGVVPITGTTDRSHMDQDLEVFDLALTEEDVALIENLSADQ